MLHTFLTTTTIAFGLTAGTILGVTVGVLIGSWFVRKSTDRTTKQNDETIELLRDRNRISGQILQALIEMKNK